MATFIEISDDDNSFSGPNCSKTAVGDEMDDDDVISFDSDNEMKFADNILLSEDEEPEVITKKNTAIKSLFPSKNKKANVKKKKQSTVKALFPPKQNVAVPKPMPTIQPIEAPKVVFNRMIEGVNVILPVSPYGSQIALMSKIITSIKKAENCILESPTGSGKTLALLCGALAWQQHEQKRMSQNQAEPYFTQYPELKKEGVAEYISTPMHQKSDVTPEKLFTKNHFGEKSIYQKPEENGASSSTSMRQEKTPYRENSEEESTSENLVKIHKRRRIGSAEYEEDDKTNTSPAGTPEKIIKTEVPDTPENVRNLYNLVENLRVCTSVLVDCSLPTIYYGARTHSQLKQVIKEFKRTSYCGLAKMTLLSSRDKCCLKEFKKDVWDSRSDMCSACTKNLSIHKTELNSCLYYDNRTALNHNTMPPAFDLEELVQIGQKKSACPYYAARLMAKTAHIVFCPYNYLIDPSIRSSLSISLTDSIVIIDEAHNIEGICRDVASTTITRPQIQNAIKELEITASYRFKNQDMASYVDFLLNALRNWDYWFENQKPLVNDMPVNNGEAVYKWRETQHFIQTLDNHNIGPKQYSEFKRHAENFCRRLREDPRTLLGVTVVTGILLESLEMVLGYMFRCECKYVDDYKPILIRHVTGKDNALSANAPWRNSQFNEWVAHESLTLSLMCMNPAIVMEGLQSTRCIALASGTLTPLISLHSELGTSFPHRVTPNHVIPEDRVWIGTLIGDASGQQQYNAAAVESPRARRALGASIVRVCTLAPHGVLCFLPSYGLLNRLVADWRVTGLWDELSRLKNVFCEKKNDREHLEVMEDFYQTVGTDKGALLFAVYRGKVSEGMDFKDHQARVVICVGIPYPNTYDSAVIAKMEYNNKYTKERSLLSGNEWLRVQAYRALNQAVGRCVRHRGDWGAVLLLDARYHKEYYTEHLSKWVKRFLGNNHHTYESLVSNSNGLAAFMQRMRIIEEEEDT